MGQGDDEENSVQRRKKPKKNGKSRRFGCVVLETLTAFATATHCTNSNVTTLVAQQKKKKISHFQRNFLKKMIIFIAINVCNGDME